MTSTPPDDAPASPLARLPTPDPPERRVFLDALRAIAPSVPRLREDDPPAVKAALRERDLRIKIELARAAAEQRALEIERAIKSRNIPSRPETRGVVRNSQVPVTPALDAIMRGLAWRERGRTVTGEIPGLVLILSGSTGCGKTAAGCWVLVRWPRTSLRVTAAELGDLPDTDWSAHVETRERWATADLLLIDDVGTETSRRTPPRVSGLLIRRYEEGRATLVTTNLSAGAFCATYLATYEEGADGDTERVAKHGNARMTSRLSHEQYRSGDPSGTPYWCTLQNQRDYRAHGEATEAAFAALPRASDEAVLALFSGDDTRRT